MLESAILNFYFGSSLTSQWRYKSISGSALGDVWEGWVKGHSFEVVSLHVDEGLIILKKIFKGAVNKLQLRRLLVGVQMLGQWLEVEEGVSSFGSEGNEIVKVWGSVVIVIIGFSRSWQCAFLLSIKLLSIISVASWAWVCGPWNIGPSIVLVSALIGYCEVRMSIDGKI